MSNPLRWGRKTVSVGLAAVAVIGAAHRITKGRRPDLRDVPLGQRGVRLCLIEIWYDLEHQIAPLHRLPVADPDLVEIPTL
jgi:hypothetical protein